MSDFRIGINFDEISDSLETAVDVMHEMGIAYGELRTLDKQNFAFWDDIQCDATAKVVNAASIELVAAASPLFKWYVGQDDPEVLHDSFGFDPRLSTDAKRQTIDNVVRNASRMAIPRLRIFSRLGKSDTAVDDFLADPLLEYALEVADSYEIDLYLENEPVCQLYTKEHIINLFEKNSHPRLKLWLDIANLIEVDQVIDDDFLAKVGQHIGYVHVKDFRHNQGIREYVAVGKGVVDYLTILGLVKRYVPVANDPIITIETHAAEQNKIIYSKESIMAVQQIVRSISNGN